MKEKLLIRVEEIVKEPYASIICYPKANALEVKNRFRELRKLGVSMIEFSGEKQVFNVPVLGKGCVSVVVAAYKNMRKIALKIRRVDANREKMMDEASKLRKANSVDVGPKFLAVSRNFLVMEFVEGDLLPTWLKHRVKKGVLEGVLRSILEQCWRLDELSLDHGELSQASKHLIIDRANRPFLVDFETASLKRRAANVTSICQFLFFSSSVAEIISGRLGGLNPTAIIEALRRYKKTRTRRDFECVLKSCSLQVT